MNRFSSGSNELPKSANLGTTIDPQGLTVEEIQSVSWFIAIIAGTAGVIQLWNKGQYVWRGWICISICTHIMVPHFSVWFLRLFSGMVFGGLWDWLDTVITVMIYACWTAIFFWDSAFNTKVVPTDKIGVFVLWEIRLPWGNKIPAGPVALPCPKWFGLKVENESSKTETTTLEPEKDKPVIIQAGSVTGTPFAVHLKATFKFKVIDPIKVKTVPLDEKLRRQVVEQALTEELQHCTDIKDVRTNKSQLALRAVLNPLNPKAAGNRFNESGYKLLSIDITSAERDPKLEAAEIDKEAQRVVEETEMLDNEGLIKQAEMFMAKGMSLEKAVSTVMTNRGRIQRIRYDGLASSPGSGKKGGKGKKGGGSPTMLIPPP